MTLKLLSLPLFVSPKHNPFFEKYCHRQSNKNKPQGVFPISKSSFHLCWIPQLGKSIPSLIKIVLHKDKFWQLLPVPLNSLVVVTRNPYFYLQPIFTLCRRHSLLCPSQRFCLLDMFLPPLLATAGTNVPIFTGLKLLACPALAQRRGLTPRCVHSDHLSALSGCLEIW